MSTIAYSSQGNLLSYFDSHIIQTATLKLKLPSPKCTKDLGGWSFLQTLPNTSKEKPEYIHPLAKQSSCYTKLSEKSLKLCTENLGSETGTDIAESTIFSSDSLPETVIIVPEKLSREVESRNRNKVKNKSRNNNFPPPLTTSLSGENSLRIMAHREGGRLIITAVEAPPKNSWLRADRSHGRLRLFFSDDSDIPNGEENDQTDETNGEVDDVNVEDDVERDMEGNILDAEVEMGMEKYQRLRRCMEGGHSNKALCDLKPLWVATS